MFMHENSREWQFSFTTHMILWYICRKNVHKSLTIYPLKCVK